MSYQWWIGKYLIIMQYFTALVFLNNVKAYILIESVILKVISCVGHDIPFRHFNFIASATSESLLPCGKVNAST